MGFAARHGRFLLVLGLVLGAGVPSLAASFAPWTPHLIATLLFLNAFRNGDALWRSLRTGWRSSMVRVLVLQLLMPLALLAALLMAGLPLGPFFFAALLMLSAPSVTGSPNFVTMMGHDPLEAMRILVIGTLVFPATAFVVLWFLPQINAAEAALATMRLASTILSVVILGVLLRRWVADRISATRAHLWCDDIAAVLLCIVVVGLMPEIGWALRDNPILAFWWVAVVMAVNFGLQILSYAVMRKRCDGGEAVSLAVISGNRNIALFLIALPQETMAQAMLFIGAYQIPMYLTPMILNRLYRKSL